MARKHEPTPRIVYRSPDGRVEIIRDGGDFYLTIDGVWAGCHRSEGAALVEATIRLGELAGLVYEVAA